MIYKSATKNILICEREDIWERKSDRDVLLPVLCRSFGISDTGDMQPEAMEESRLFRVLRSDSPYSFFWKDKEEDPWREQESSREGGHPR